MMTTPTDATAPLQQLAARLEQLRAARHPLGVTRQAARRFVRDVEAGGDLAQALRGAGSAGPLADVIAQARPGDAVGVVSRLLPVLGEVATLRQSLRSAAGYPLALVLCLVVVAVAVYDVSIPAITTLAAMTGGPGSQARAGEGLAVVTCGSLLVLLAMATFTQVPVPLLSRGRLLLERVLVLETVAQLTVDGVPLPRALRAASLWLRGRARGELEALTQAIERGAAPEGPCTVLDPTSRGLLVSAAERGVVAAAVSALASQAKLAARRRIPEEVLRIHTLALGLSGLALGVVAFSFFEGYVRAATGSGVVP